jgi:GT2 family glycosyltransferase
MSYDRFVDERLLTSRDALNKMQIKMKVLQIDENARDFSQRFGHRVLIQKVLLTIQYNETEEVEEKELDVAYGNVQILGDLSWAKDGIIYDGEFTRKKLFLQNICHQAILYKRTVFEKVGFFNTAYRICADWDFNHRCFAKAKTLYIPVTVAKFFAGGESTRRNHDMFTDHDFVLNLHNYYSISYFNRLFKGYSWVFMNVSFSCFTKGKYLKSIMFFFVAMYHSPSRKKTVSNFLSNILIARKTQSAKSSN